MSSYSSVSNHIVCLIAPVHIISSSQTKRGSNDSVISRRTKR
jgi:hypothetical protein